MPILYAERSEPLNAEDSGWQFVCNSGRSEENSQGHVWSIHEVLALEPSLCNLMTAPAGTRVYRVNRQAPWTEDRSTVH